MQKVEIDINHVKELLSLGCSRVKIASKLGVSISTLHRFLKANNLTGEMETKIQPKIKPETKPKAVSKPKQEKHKTETNQLNTSAFDEFEQAINEDKE